MSKTTRQPIPVNLISGPLGVGKTTSINHLLELKPDDEKWAILVNEYGMIGLDAALMRPLSGSNVRTGVDIREVAGGCICCSAGLMFEVSLVMLLQRRPHRLLIEPTGLAALSGILDTLDRPGIRESVDVRSIICLLDPKRFESDIRRNEMHDQVEAADIILASRSDLATESEMQAFTSWADSLFPRKRFIGSIEHGQFGLDLLDMVSDRVVAVSRAGHQHGTDHQQENQRTGSKYQTDDRLELMDDDAQDRVSLNSENPVLKQLHRSPLSSTVGWICWAELVFDSDRVFQWLRGLGQHPNIRRTKAVIRSNEGWLGYNAFDGVETIRRVGYRRDSRLEFIFDGENMPETADLEKAFLACLLTPSEPS